MKSYVVFVAFSLSLLLLACGGNKELTDKKPVSGLDNSNRGYFRVMFYNTENLFDTFDDTLKNDEQFLPTGDKYWNTSKYNKKLVNICKVIVAVGGWEPPDIVGLCEVENRLVLDDLLKKTPLSNLDYKISHFESPDNRGIDVALLYRSSRFKVISEKPVKIVFPFDANKPTRDILYVKGETYKNDTLHVFINHWPSRWGGQMETDDKREFVASVLRKQVDSILETNAKANIIITGDLNDYSDNNSLVKILKSKTEWERADAGDLYDLTAHLQEKEGKGTHKYDGEWGVLDHIIVSGALLQKSNPYTSASDAHIFDAPFLLEKDEKNVGMTTFRTYIGFKFHDGFSDHLPVYLDLRRK